MSRLNERMNMRKGRRMRACEKSARTDPAKSPIFHKTIANGTKISGSRKRDPVCSTKFDVILLANTGKIEEMQMHKKLALAAHCSPLQLGTHLLHIVLNGIASLLLPRLSPRARIVRINIDIPLKRIPEEKYAVVGNIALFEFEFTLRLGYIEGKVTPNTISDLHVR